MPKKEFLVTPLDGVKQRIDIFLAGRIRDLSRSQIQKLFEEERIRLNGQIQKPSYKLRIGDRINIDYDLSSPQKIQPENIPLKVLYSDHHILVIDKPSGMIVHPGTGTNRGTLVNALLYHFPGLSEVGPEQRPGIVHRLDKETSGLMVVARTPKARLSLQRQFKQKQVKKLYLGLVWGKISQQKGKISWPIGRHPKHGERISVKTKKPRNAETHYSILKKYKEFTLLEIKPITGRTHQIRVHLAAAGHPLVGDSRYGRRKGKVCFPRLFLHACRLSFIHPETGERVEFFSLLPEDLKNLLDTEIKNSG